MDNNDVVAARRRALQEAIHSGETVMVSPTGQVQLPANRMILPVREFRSRRVSLLKAGGSNNGILLVSE